MTDVFEAATPNTKQPAGHEEAFFRQTAQTQSLIDERRIHKPNLDLLEYGCGWRGAQRVILEGIKTFHDRLALYDPHVEIRPPTCPNERIVDHAEIFGPGRRAFDIITLSYVLCCVSPKTGMGILQSLRAAQPQADMLIVDYTLNNRSQMEVLDLLTSREEMKWREAMGEQEFAETRRQFSPETLAEFVRSSGHNLQGGAIFLDEFGIRAAVVTHSSQNGRRV
ncbi:hypothetical protein AUJ46_05375 [Candidatus Peregrinibacteria bacterium CG1_02_54_53]|nr:MAG: hypothetical protein AUJ46_05375 [Candidatus Peregrinibacteria bacterium CG1_02_54_53]